MFAGGAFKDKPFVYFASFQDLLGKQDDGSTKKHNEWLADIDWDIVIQDEYHYGAFRDSAKELVGSDDEVDQKEVSLTKNDESPYCYMCKAKLFITFSKKPQPSLKRGLRFFTYTFLGFIVFLVPIMLKKILASRFLLLVLSLSESL